MSAAPRRLFSSRSARVRLIVLLGLAWIGGIGYRLYQLQVLRHSDFQERAQRQQESRVELDAPRGSILDSRGRELAVSVPSFTIYADPSRIEDRNAVIEGLSPLLGVQRRELRERLGRGGEFVFVARKVDASLAERVRELGLRGVGLLEESRRLYPRGALAAQVLGFVGTDNHGLAGLESGYDAVIAGRAAQRRVLRDAHRTLVVEPSALDDEAEAGADLLLTLDASLQYVAEKELAAAVDKWQARGGTVVILDARDSAILALASYPPFDPNEFQRAPRSAWRNRAVMDAYEPGSTFKMITAAAAIDTLAVHPDDRLDCEMGGITLSNTYIGDHKPFGVLTFRDVIANSSNVGVIKAALRTGTDAIYATTVAFGFGRATGVDLPGESAGIVRPRERWQGLATAYASFGHGLSVTPLQLANAYAALASGARHRPYIVRALVRQGEVEPVPAAEPEPLPISAATRQTLVRLLEGVVEHGTGKAAAIRGYRIAGKTGTAEKSDSSGYSATGRVASFVGMAPSRQPRLVCAVMLDEPRLSHSGGVVAAPVFAKVMGEALLYLGIPPVAEALDPSEQVARYVRLAPGSRPRPPAAAFVEGASAPRGAESVPAPAVSSGGGP